MKFFSIDSPLYKFMQRLMDVLILNLLWLLFSIPVVTLGTSTISAFSVGLNLVEETEGHIFNDFIKAFKSNIKQGIPMSFIFIISIYAVVFDFQLYRYSEKTGENGLIFLIFGIIAAYILTLSLLYVFPLLARYENTIYNSLKNSFRLSMKYFGRTLLLIVLIIAELAVIFWNTTTLFVGILIGPACLIYTISGTAMHIFREIEKIPGSVSEKDESEYNEAEEK